MAHLVSVAPSAGQAQVEFIPSLSLSSVYDDNIYARVNGTAGQMLLLRPSFEGSYESPRFRQLGLYSFDMQRSNFSSLNTLDARRHALAETRYRITPFTTMGLTMRYDRSETPGEIDADSGLLGERRQAQRLELTPAIARRLGPRTTVSAGYDFSTEHLIEGDRGTMHVGRLGISRDVSTRTSLTAGYVGRHFLDPLFRNTSHAALFGWNRVLAPGTRLTIAAGPKTTSYDGLDVEASAAFSRVTNRLNLAFDYWHGETIVLGVIGPVAVDSMTSRITWPLGPRFEISTHGGVSDIGTIDDRAARIYRGTLGASWSPSSRYVVAAAYGMDYQDGSIRRRLFLDGEPVLLDAGVLRHVFRVSVTVAPRYKRSILPPDEAARAKGVTR
jgi:hypothetical protein